MDKNNNMSKNPEKINIIVPEDKKTGIYSNAVSVSINENDMTIDFGYIIPGSNPISIETVARINMCHKVAESFLHVLQNTILDFKNRKDSFNK